MAKFDTTKAAQGAINIGAQGAFIGNMLKKKYGNKAIGIGSGIGAGIGFALGGLQGTPDTELGAKAYKGVYDSVRADTMQQAREASRAVGDQVQNYLARRGISGSDAAVGIHAANQGRIFGQAQRSLIPLETDMRLRAAQDRLEAQRVGEYEKRQGFSGALTAAGVTAMNAAKILSAEHETQVAKDKLREQKILPQGFLEMDAASQSAYLRGKGIMIPPGWETMTPQQRVAFIQGAGLLVPQGPMADTRPDWRTAEKPFEQFAPGPYGSVYDDPETMPAAQAPAQGAAQDSMHYGPEQRAQQEAEIARRQSGRAKPTITAPPAQASPQNRVQGSSDERPAIRNMGLASPGSMGGQIKDAIFNVPPEYIKPDGTFDQERYHKDHVKNPVFEIPPEYINPDGTFDQDRYHRDHVKPMSGTKSGDATGFGRNPDGGFRPPTVDEITTVQSMNEALKKTPAPQGKIVGNPYLDTPGTLWSPNDPYEDRYGGQTTPPSWYQPDNPHRDSNWNSARKIAEGWATRDRTPEGRARLRNEAQKAWIRDVEFEARRIYSPESEFMGTKIGGLDGARKKLQVALNAIAAGEPVAGKWGDINFVKAVAARIGVELQPGDPNGEMPGARLSKYSRWNYFIPTKDPKTGEWKQTTREEAQESWNNMFPHGYGNPTPGTETQSAPQEPTQAQGSSGTTSVWEGLKNEATGNPTRLSGIEIQADRQPKPTASAPSDGWKGEPPVAQQRIHKFPAPSVEPVDPYMALPPAEPDGRPRINAVTPPGNPPEDVQGFDRVPETLPSVAEPPARATGVPGIDMLKVHEGFRASPYRDTEGKLTIGFGRNLDDNPLTANERAHLGLGPNDPITRITQEEAEYLFNNDLMRASNSAINIFGDTWGTLNDARKSVITNMIYNMGEGSFNEFQKMIKAIKEGDWNKAAQEMLLNSSGTGPSDWASTVGQRANELAEIMRTGRMPGETTQEVALQQSTQFRGQLDPSEQQYLEEQSKTATTSAELAQWQRNTPMAIQAIFQNPNSELASALLAPHTGHIFASAFAKMGDAAAAEAIAAYNMA